MAAQVVGNPEDCNWSYSGSNTSGSIPSIMIFRPTWEEFKDFNKYLEYVESKGAQKAGICKIIPPKEWEPRKKKFNIDDLENVKIPDPIEQAVNGNQGIFQCFNVKKRSMTAKEYYNKANSPKYKAPGQVTDLEDLERKYWKNITFVPPIYGADVPGSVTDNDCNVWNIQKLGSVLDWINEDYNVKISGVNTAYLYFGMWKSTFAWHTEDMDLHSINYLHYGESKFWYSIPPAYARRFEGIAERLFPFLHKECPSYLRHKMCLISPNVLRNNSIPYNKIAQKEGEIMITFPLGYHSGFNTGFNVAESTNFATKRWVEYGKRATRCYCRSEAVHISMDCFVRRLQPDRYEDWLAGRDMGRHPEEPDARPTPAPPPNVEEFLMNINNKDVDIPLCLLEPTKPQKQKRRHPIHKKNNSESKDIKEDILKDEPQVKINRLTEEDCRKYSEKRQKDSEQKRRERQEAFTTDEEEDVKPPSADLWNSFETITGDVTGGSSSNAPSTIAKSADKESGRASNNNRGAAKKNASKGSNGSVSKSGYVIPKISKISPEKILDLPKPVNGMAVKAGANKAKSKPAERQKSVEKVKPRASKAANNRASLPDTKAVEVKPELPESNAVEAKPDAPKETPPAPAKMSETAKNNWVTAFTKEATPAPAAPASNTNRQSNSTLSIQKLKNSLATASPRPPERAYIRPPQFQYNPPPPTSSPAIRQPPPAHASSSTPRAAFPVSGSPSFRNFSSARPPPAHAAAPAPSPHPHPAYLQAGRPQLTAAHLTGRGGQPPDLAPHGISLNEYFSTLNPISPMGFGNSAAVTFSGNFAGGSSSHHSNTHHHQPTHPNNHPNGVALHEQWSMAKPRPTPTPIQHPTAAAPSDQQQQGQQFIVTASAAAQQQLTLVNFMGLQPTLQVQQVDPLRAQRLHVNRLLLASNQKRPIKTSISVVTSSVTASSGWQLEGFVSMADGAIYIYLSRQDGTLSTKSFFLPFRDILGKRRVLTQGDVKEAWPPSDDLLATTEDLTAWELHMVINSAIIEMNIIDPWRKSYLVKIPGTALT